MIIGVMMNVELEQMKIKSISLLTVKPSDFT